MRFLYLDNFRGFKDATVPLLDVNFLVGENSTGKTSLLTALRMLTNRTLIFGMQTMTNLSDQPQHGIEVGHFSEMVSAHSVDKSYFRLGLIYSQKHAKSGDLSFAGLLVTYEEVDGVPTISRITCRSENCEISVNLKVDKFTFNIEKKEPVDNLISMGEFLASWAKLHAGGQEVGWKQSSLPKGFNARQFPLIIILSVAARDATEGNFLGPVPDVGPEIVWIAPIRTKALRTYDDPHTHFSPDGAHTPYVIRRMLESSEKADNFRKFINKVGSASGLFEKIEIKYFNTEKNGPFEVDAIIDGEALSLGWLGYGVSQSLPILVELIFRQAGTCFAIQQPEVHLHPRAQSSLGDAFFEMAMTDRKTFVVETHSDFTIDRFRMNYRKKRSAKARAALPRSQILFFERCDKSNKTFVIPINENGDLDPHQPDNYRNFFVKEEIRLISSS